MVDVGHLMLRRSALVLLRLRAKRYCVWFRALNRLDRALVNLTISVANRVQSLKLVQALSKVISKIEKAFENRISHAVYTIGFFLARKLSMLAKKWGNPSADGWISDVSFAKFLAIIHINSGQKPKESLLSNVWT